VLDYHYILFHKPYGVVCQFTDKAGRPTLADFGPFPKDVYPAGRLDADSEGLVLLTNDGPLQNKLLEPRYDHPRTYWVQVERIPSENALDQLREGIIIEGRKTKPAEVQLLPFEPPLPPRSVPIRFRKYVPTVWLDIVLREGRNRQVRRMTAAIGHPTLRLVRVKIGTISLGDLAPGEWRDLTPEEIQILYSLVKG
jgi:23S rRNA pseudouridine2457 synthase